MKSQIYGKSLEQRLIFRNILSNAKRLSEISKKRWIFYFFCLPLNSGIIKVIKNS